MALPREPRQKMINMMYLVLTALLALNVSSEILNAFKTVNNSLEKTNTVVDNSTVSLMSSLQQKLSEAGTKDKAAIWFPNAKKATGYATAVYNYLDSLKMEILKKAGADYAKGDSSFKEDNLDITTRMMIDKGEGKKVFNTLSQYKNDLLSIDPLINKQLGTSLPIDLSIPKTKSKSNKSWEYAYFHMVPTVAALTMLSKFQNDVKVSENKIIAFCHEQVGKVEVQQDAYAAIAVADASYVLPGQDINVTAGVGGFSTKVSPRISINGQGVNVDADGTAKLKIKGSALGSHTIPVHIEFTDQNNVVQKKDIPIQYTVGQSNAAVQLDKMNVLFIGVDNPMTISGSGSVDQLQVSASGGGAVLSGSGANRTIRVSSETDNCTVSVRTPDGKVTPVRFRVRSIPDPTPRVGASESGDMPAAVFKSQAGVNAIVKNFFYETQFNVTTFRITAEGDGFPEGIEEAVNSGAAWNEARRIVSKCRPGSFITIEDIRAVGPDNRTRKLTPLIFNLK